MNLKIYINYLADGGHHSGVYRNDVFAFSRDAQPGTTNRLKGYIDVRLNEGEEQSWGHIHSLLSRAYEKFGPLEDNMSYNAETEHGSFEMHYRKGLPSNAEDAIGELKRHVSGIILDDSIFELPEDA